MPGEKPEWGLDIEVMDLENHVRIEFRDKITAATQIRLIDIIRGLHRNGQKTRFIVNTQGCAIDYPLVDRYRVGAYIAENLPAGVSMACIIDKQHLTGLVENAAHNRGGVGLRVVTNEKDALDWVAG